jgi:ribosome biogenesis GTPase
MIEIFREPLGSLGLTPDVAAQAAALDEALLHPHSEGTAHAGARAESSPAPGIAARVGVAATPPPRLFRLVELHRETVVVHDGVAEHVARVRPALVRGFEAEDAELAVGDWVVARRDPHAAWWVEARLAPRSHLARRDPDGRRHPLASNVDIALLVMGLDGDWNLRRLERYVALAESSGVLPVAVLTKADLLPPEAVAVRLAALCARLPARVEAHALDATDGSAPHVLAAHVGRGRTLVALGSSGAGKSTLTNALLGAAVQWTGPVRVHDSRGQHTTTVRSLHCLPQGGCVIDTPGLRTLRLDIDPEALAASFDDVEALAARCRFRDCRHAGEPGCAVRAVVDDDRLGNYAKLLREARRDTLTPYERRERVAAWKARSRETRAWMKMKRGA